VDTPTKPRSRRTLPAEAAAVAETNTPANLDAERRVAAMFRDRPGVDRDPDLGHEDEISELEGPVTQLRQPPDARPQANAAPKVAEDVDIDLSRPEFSPGDMMPVRATGTPRPQQVTRRELDRIAAPFTKKQPEPDPRDEFSRIVGARNWIQSARFDWSVSFDGTKHVYTRCYFRQFGVKTGVILDSFPNDGREVRREIVEKTAAIEKYNAANPDKPYGYLPMIARTPIPPDVVDHVLNGGISSLIGGAPIEIVA
jgi:hypothetical protein